MIGKILIFGVSALAIVNTAGALLCEKDPRSSPSLCSSYTSDSVVDSNAVSGCSGSSTTHFEVWGGCSPSSGSGSLSNPIVQISPGIQLPTVQAGPYCFCQIKSINGIDMASSNKWIYASHYSMYGSWGCAVECALNCASNAQSNAGYRSILFSAVSWP